MRRRTFTIATIVLLGLAAVIPGGFWVAQTFATTFSAPNTYSNSQFTTATTLGPPTGTLTITPSGNTATYGWTVASGTYGNQQGRASEGHHDEYRLHFGHLERHEQHPDGQRRRHRGHVECQRHQLGGRP